MMQLSLPSELVELKPLKQWVCYKLEWNEKKQKYGKIPKNPATGYGAKANDPATWGTYAEAAAAAERLQLDGVGFEFAAGYMGIDLDNVINDKGDLKAFAAEIVETLDSYTEYSPSGNGLHILIKTTLENIGSRNDTIGLEMYNNGRFFTVTGNIYGKPQPIQERTAQAQAVLNKYLKKAEKAAKQQSYHSVGSYFTEDSEDLWQKMFDSRKGSEIRALYNGDISSYADDHSRADQALMNHLAYWTNGDAYKMDLMFRQSGLMRDKWNERRGTKTYGEKTIENALMDFVPYTPPVRQVTKNKGKVLENESTKKKTEMQGDEIMESVENNIVKDEPETQQPEQKKKDTKPDGIGKYLNESFNGDRERFLSYKDRKTGYSNIDLITSLYPGLYVIGAVSSLGKTTFTFQMGEQLAASGDHVLYFSLEQTRFEMVSKGLSRRTAIATLDSYFKDAVSAINIRNGFSSNIINEAEKNYIETAANESIIECGFNTTIDAITGYVKDYIKNNNVKPVVIVDYLQIIQPVDPKQSTKDAVDSHVRALKKLQTDNDLVVIVISSLNRQNYLTPVDFESFKESGGIEYTADVVWGLQLAIMNDELFDSKEKLKKKREAVKQAKLKIPREIELVCLKNRYGKSSYSCGFNYYPQFDLFIPDDGFVPVSEDQELPFDGTLY